MAEKIKNPFLHPHDGDHGLPHDHEPFEPTDPAQKSLADAMRVSFMILKFIMVLMVIFYASTGIFAVKSDQQVVRLQFGKIIGEDEGLVYGQGWYVGWPYPIEEKVTVPITEQTISIRKAFWQETGDATTDGLIRGGPLNPEKDGSLLTGDANIAHGRFKVNYVIDDVIDFVKNVGLVKPGDPRYPHQTDPRPLRFADDLVANVAEQGIVYAAARARADDFIKGEFGRDVAVNRMQQVLDSLGAGIKIVRLIVDDSEAPLAVQPAYNLVTNAQSDRGQKISAARQKRTTLLNEAAGEAHGELFALLREYELSRSAGDADKAQALALQIDTAFDRLRMPPELGGAAIGGEASKLISEANTYRTETVERVKAEANSFRTLLSKYREAPELFTSREWQQAREAIFTGDVETLYNNGGQLYLETNTDPEIARQRQLKARDEADAAAQAGENP
jgi:modulator of FtsH protease HflK